MVLIFLVGLAFLIYAIMGELERRHEETLPVCGSCPACSRPVETDWLLCPHCRTLLKEGCSGCGRPLPVFHRFCFGCGRRREEGK